MATRATDRVEVTRGEDATPQLIVLPPSAAARRRDLPYPR